MGILSFLFGCSGESNYHKKAGKWHYDGAPVDSVDEPVNLKVIDKYFAKDDKSGFYRGSRIYHDNDASDAATFEALNTWYAKDKFRVYYCDTARDSKEYWSIKRNVILTITEADAATFRLFSDGYTARDKKHLFQENKIVPVRDLESYEILEHAFTKDKLRAYYRTTEIPGSDGLSFAVLDAHYAKDKSKIYFVSGFYIGGSIKGVRYESFKALGDGYATDGSNAYYAGAVLTKRDGGALQYLQAMGYAKTRQQVFHHGEVMPDADAASFATTEKFNAAFDATDKLGHFSAGKRVAVAP